MLRTTIRLAGLALVCAHGPTPAAAQATPPAEPGPPATVYVVDGSGSMWGNLAVERLAKLDLVRASLRKSLERVGSDARIGLVAFGHRRRGDCSDVETVAPAEGGPPDRIPALVDKVSPKGKGPLTLALREAAKSFPAGTPGQIVLIHDGADNCGLDTCQAAGEIARANPKVAVNIVGLALEKPDAQRLACVTKATRGRMLEVRDAAALDAALTEIAKLGGLDAPLAPAPSAAKRPAGPEETAPGIRLTAQLAADGPALAAASTWRVSPAGKPEDVVVQAVAPSISADLAPGDYDVEVTHGLATAKQRVTVAEKGATAAAVALGAGVMKLDARSSHPDQPLASPLIKVARVASADAEPDPLWVGQDGAAELVVPEGAYRVEVDDGATHVAADAAVTAGKRVEVALPLATGRLDVSAVTAPGTPPLPDVVFSISVDDPDAPGGRREITRSAHPTPSFNLPAGTYYVSGSHQLAEARERVAVGTAATVTHALVLPLANVTLTATIDGAAPAANQALTLRVLDTSTPPRELARRSGQSATLALGPGRYRVEAETGALNIRGAAQIDVVAGKDYKVALKLESAEVSVPATDGPRTWEIKDGSGITVLRSGAGRERSRRVAPGRYVLRVEDGERRAEQAFDLKAGERREVDPGTL